MYLGTRLEILDTKFAQRLLHFFLLIVVVNLMFLNFQRPPAIAMFDTLETHNIVSDFDTACLVLIASCVKQ